VAKYVLVKVVGEPNSEHEPLLFLLEGDGELKIPLIMDDDTFPSIEWCIGCGPRDVLEALGDWGVNFGVKVTQKDQKARIATVYKVLSGGKPCVFDSELVRKLIDAILLN
jgi:hypothetical protein